MSYNRIFANRKNVFPYFEEIYKNKILYPDLKDNNTNFGFRIRPINILSAPAQAVVTRAYEAGIGSLLEIYVESKIIGEGPKIFKFDQLQLEALENIDININFHEYNQPFETVLVEFSESYYQNKITDCAQAGEGEFPNRHRPILLALTYISINSIPLLIFNVFFDSTQVYSSFIHYVNDTGTIEEALTVCSKNEENYVGSMEVSREERKVAFDLARAGINGMLLVDEVGIKKVGPQNPSYYEKLKRQKATEVNRREIRTHPIYYTLQQNVELFSREINRTLSSLDTTKHDIMRPHWRRGHYRFQPYGINRSLRKRIRIAPILVNSHLFLGKHSNTTATYKL